MEIMWKSTDIPDKFLGNEHKSGNDYVTTYRTEILLPKNSAYAGYCFLHPSKLINYRANGFIKIVYNDTFTFDLFKKDREPGKRYKRYKLTVAEILGIYEKEANILKEKIAKRELQRKARIGSVELLDCRSANSFQMHVVFRYKQSDYNGVGSAVKHGDIHKRHVIVQNIPCSLFENTYNALCELLEEYRVVSKIRYELEHSSSNDAVTGSFGALCEQWEFDFIKKADVILASALLE